MTFAYQLSQFRGYDSARIGDYATAAKFYELAVEQFPKTRGSQQTREFKRLARIAANYRAKAREQGT